MAPHPHNQGVGRPGLLVALALGVLVLGGVFVLLSSKKAPTTPNEQEAAAPATPPDEGPPDQTYTLNGHIVALPTDDRPMQINHEAIPDFKNAAGEEVGMGAMTMPFPLADGVDISDLQVGDPVEFTFEVRWSSDEKYHITSISKRPDDAETP